MRRHPNKKDLFVFGVIVALAVSVFCPFAVALNVSEDNDKDKEMAVALILEETEIKLAQREKSWNRRQVNDGKAQAKEETQAKKFSLDVGGYYKNLFTESKTLNTKEDFFADTQRLRLEFRLDMLNKWQANLAYDNEVIFNDFSRTPDFDLIRDKNQKKLSFLDTDKVYTDRDHVYTKGSLYRAYLKYFDPKLQFVLGKQKVDWGRCRFFSPMDLFNPVSPLNIERDERIGADAANLEVPLSSFSNLNFIYAPRKAFRDTSLGSRLYFKAQDYDLFLMAGEFQEDEVAGFAFDGYIGNGGFRGEFTQTHADSGRDFFRAVIGAEYNFPNKIYLLSEYFYNGGADKSDPSSFFGSYRFFSKTLTQKKHHLGAWVGYEVTPLLKWDNYSIYDFEGESFFFNPEFTYNFRTNLDLSIGSQLFWGDNSSEFGPYQNLYYVQAKYFF